MNIIRTKNISKLMTILNKMTALRTKMENILQMVSLAMSENRIDTCNCIDTRKIILNINALVHKEEQIIKAITLSS